MTSTYPGMETSDSQRTIVSSTTVSVTAGPRQRPPNMAIAAASRATRANSQPTPLLRTLRGSGGGSPEGRRRRPVASRAAGC
jgi:hypothetical protein